MKVSKFLSSAVAVGAAMSLTSCDETKDLYKTATDKVQEFREEEKPVVSEEVVTDVRNVSDTEGQSVIRNERRLVVLEFYSNESEPCHKVAPVLDRLASMNADKVRIIKVDADKYKDWAKNQNVRGVPAFRLYNGGMLVDQFTGAYPENALQGKIDKYYDVLSSSRPAKPVAKGENGEEPAPPKEPAIRPMPSDWLPPGVSGG